MTPKRLTTIRLSALTDKQITELCERLGVNQSELITLAIDRIYQQELGKDKDPT